MSDTIQTDPYGIMATIAEYREHLSRFRFGQSAALLFGMERHDYEKTVKEALLIALPRLYALNFEDQEDAPIELYRLIEMIEQDLAMDLEEDDEA